MKTFTILKPDGTVERETYEGDEPTLKRAQEIVGGYIEHRRVIIDGTVFDALINEDPVERGTGAPLPYNARATSLLITAGYAVDPERGVVGNLIVLGDVK